MLCFWNISVSSRLVELDSTSHYSIYVLCTILNQFQNDVFFTIQQRESLEITF